MSATEKIFIVSQSRKNNHCQCSWTKVLKLLFQHSPDGRVLAAVKLEDCDPAYSEFSRKGDFVGYGFGIAPRKIIERRAGGRPRTLIFRDRGRGDSLLGLGGLVA